MMGNMQIFAAVASAVFFALIAQGNALRCYTCSSDIDRHCGDPFNTTLLTPTNWGGEAIHHTLQDCNQITSQNMYNNFRQKPVCRKIVQFVNGHETIIRGCDFVNMDEKVGKCPNKPTATYIKTEFCETCEQDGCNGAMSNVDFSSFLKFAALVPIVCSLQFLSR